MPPRGTHARTPYGRARGVLATQGRSLPIRERLDLVLVSFIVGVVALVLGGWSLFVAVANQRGWLEPALLQPLPDRRILTNVRDGIDGAPLLAAALEPATGALYVSQTGGLLHRYDTRTGLWSTVTPADAFSLRDPNLSALRSGCGADSLSDRLDDCPDPSTLWAVTAAGGLLREVGNRWELLNGDSAFLGPGGLPVDKQELTGAAISADGTWLALGTRSSGVGLYNLRQGQWLTLAGRADLARLADQELTQVTWWGDRFWLGGERELVSVSVGSGGAEILAQTVMTGTVLDLAASADSGLWALMRRTCATGGTCQWVGRWQNPGRPPLTLLDEAEHFASVNLLDLDFAQQWGDALVLAGTAGLYQYDTRLHTWSRLFDGRVTATLVEPAGSGFYFGFLGGVGHADARDVRIWTIEGEVIIQLAYADEGEVLALTRAGNVYSIRLTTDAASNVFERSQTSFDPAQFSGAASAGDYVLLAGPEGVLLHDYATRSYVDVLADSLPGWITDPETLWASVAATAFALDRSSQPVQIYALDSATFADAAAFEQAAGQAAPVQVPGPIGRVWPWGANRLGVLAGDGSVYQTDGAGGIDRRTGPNTLAIGPYLDAASLDRDLVLLDGTGLRRYSAQSRSWGAVFGTQTTSPFQEIVAFGTTLLARTADGQLASARPGQVAFQINSDQPLAVSSAGLSDARLIGAHLLLAGDGAIDSYDLDQRQVVETWDLPGQDRVTLKGLVDGDPVALSGGVASWGETVVDASAGPVLSLSLQAAEVWTVRQANTGPYLASYALDNGRASRRGCFFRSPVSQGNDRTVYDARLLSDESSLAIATQTGLHFYSPAARSWYRGLEGALPAGTRLYRLGDELVLVVPEGDAYRITWIALDSIHLPDSCSADAAELDSRSQVARAVAVDEAAGRLAWLTAAGTVNETAVAGSAHTLPASSAGPEAAAILRAYQRPGRLLVTTPAALWSYDMSQRRWTSFPLRLPANAVVLTDVNVELDGDDERVVGRTAAGALYVGTLGSQAKAVDLVAVVDGSLAVLGASGDHILDVQEHAGNWLFVLDDQLKAYSPAERRWIGASDPLGLDATRELLAGPNMLVLAEAQGSVWRVGMPGQDWPSRFAAYSLASGESTALDSDGTIWRLDPVRGLLSQCPYPRSGDYSCTPYLTPPLMLVPDQVLSAIQWQGIIVFVTQTGIRAYDPDRHQELPLRAEAVDFGAGTEARFQDERLWLHVGDRVLNLKVINAASKRVQADIFEGVLDLIYDNAEHPWGRFADGWRRWDEDLQAWLATDPDQVPAEQNLRVFAVENAQVTGVDAGGYLYWWEGQWLRTLATLPPEIALDGVTGLVRGTADDWWVFSGTHLDHLAPKACADTPDAPCLDVVAQVDLSSVTSPTGTTAILCAAAGTDNLVLTRADGVALILPVVAPASLSQQSGAAGACRAGLPSNDWSFLSTNAVALGAGGWAYDPPQALRLGPQGQLQLQRPTGLTELAPQAALQLTKPSALDAGWLQWDRQRQGFSVATNSGVVFYPKTDFVVDGHLLFEPVAALLSQVAGLNYAANAHGIWTYTHPDLRLNDGNITFQPVTLLGALTAAHGRFWALGGSLVPGDAQLQADSNQVQVSVADAVVRELVREHQVSAEVPVSGHPISAYGGTSFVWDQDRRGLMYLNGELWLQAAIGLVPVKDLSAMNVGPAGQAASGRQLTSEGPRGLVSYDGQVWYERNGSTWGIVANDPVGNRVMLDNATWNWALQSGSLHVSLAGASHQFALATGPDGLYFTFDRLRSATAYQGRLFVMSDAFLEVAGQATELGNLSTARFAPQPTDNLETLQWVDGSEHLYRRIATELSEWDAATQQFLIVPGTASPFEQRVLVETDRLRFTLVENRVTSEISLDTVGGPRRWSAFSVTADHHLPFDVVTSIAVQGDTLFVGSMAGLQLYRAVGQYGLGNMATLYDLAGPVRQVGQTVADPAQVVATGLTRSCLTWKGGVAAVCGESSTDSRRLRIQNDIWRWIDSPTGLTGEYFDAFAGVYGPSIQVQNGRLPHDQIQDVQICGGQAYSLAGAWVTEYPDDTLALQSGVRAYALDQYAPGRLVCLAEDTTVVTTTVPAGLYVSGSEGRFWQLRTGGWQPVADVVATAELTDRLNSPSILERPRLRLRPLPTSGFVFEQRADDSHWRTLPWENGQIAIDTWQALLPLDGQIWAASPIGLVAFDRDAAGSARWDAGRARIVREPLVDGQTCAVSDMALFDGQVVVRCNGSSSQVFTGQLGGSGDSGLLTAPLAVDLFESAVLVPRTEPGYWEWRRSARVNGQPGYLQANWCRPEADAAVTCSEEISLTGGRFDFDTLGSLAMFSPGQLEIATTAAGWFQSGLETLALKNWRRPQIPELEPSELTSVAVTGIGTEARLCLGASNPQGALPGPIIIWAPGVSPESRTVCREYQADDGLWRYEREGDSLAIRAYERGVGGDAQRTLIGGRFGDDIILGLPVTGRDNAGVYYLVPTFSGVLRFGPDGSAYLIHAGPFAGLEEQGLPSALYMLEPDEPLYASPVGLYQLMLPREASTAVIFSQPVNGRLRGLEDGPQGSVRLRMDLGAGGQVWQLADRAAEPSCLTGYNGLCLNTTDFKAYVRTLAAGSTPAGAPWLTVVLDQRQLRFSWAGAGQALTLNLRDDFELIEPGFVVGNRLYLVGRNDVLQIGVERVVEALARQSP